MPSLIRVPHKAFEKKVRLVFVGCLLDLVMKNILAKGGIEFLAVLLGISGSMYIDDRREDAAINKQIHSSLYSLKGELITNVEYLKEFEESISKRMYLFEIALNPDTLMFLSSLELDKMDIITSTNWGKKMNERVFNSMEATGLIYKIKNDSLRTSIINLFNKKYANHHYLLDYDLTHIQKKDDISISSFVYRDDPSSYYWTVDWQNPKNILQYSENLVFRNYLIANRANKRLIKDSVLKLITDTKVVIDHINNFIN